MQYFLFNNMDIFSTHTFIVQFKKHVIKAVKKRKFMINILCFLVYINYLTLSNSFST